ncbi:MAG: gamma subclass chorismate mutase AroQ [Terrimicrobiaceae bacterium]
MIKSAAAFLPAAPDFRKILLLVCPLILTSCSTPPLPEESEPVVDLMAERLVLARDVAWAKWASGLPVRDPAREAIVVERLMRQGEIAGLEELSVLRFVKAQIEASCLEQESWMAKWGKDTPLPAGDPPALESLRQRLDRSSALLLAEWAGTPSTSPAAVRARLLPSVINPRSAAVAASGFPPQEKSPFRAGDLR